MLDWLTYEGLTLQQFFNPDVLEWKRPPSIMVVHSTEGAGFPSISTWFGVADSRASARRIAITVA